MVETMLVDNTNALNVAILPILNGTVPFTNVKHVDRQHLDTHNEHVMDASTMTEFMAITILKENTMGILLKNVKISIHCLHLFIFLIAQKSNDSFQFPFFLHLLILFNKLFTMFPPPTSCFNPVTHLSTDKPYPPAILVKNPTWFLKDADLFICRDHILYGVHWSNFNQSPLFREIILYGESSKIGTNPYHPIPFDTLTKEVFHNFLYLLYFGTDHLDHLTLRDWLNIKRLSTDWYFPWITVNIIRKLITIQRQLVPPPFWMMGNLLPVYRVFDEQGWLSRRIHGCTILVEESSDEEYTIVEDNDA
jgi:hypothetical protein